MSQDELIELFMVLMSGIVLALCWWVWIIDPSIGFGIVFGTLTGFWIFLAGRFWASLFERRRR